MDKELSFSSFSITPTSFTSDSTEPLDEASPSLFTPNDVYQFSGATLISLGILMSFMVSVIVLGNALVILVFVTDKSLKNHSNFLLFNLAICDFCVGSFSIPLYIPYVLTGKWLLGRFLCKLWLSVDTVLCVTSIGTIVLISYDRFLSVTKAVEYRIQQQMSHKALKKILCAWMCSITLYCPPIIFWEYIIGESTVPTDACFYEFNSIWNFLLVLSLCSLIIPAVLVSYFNLIICWKVKESSKKRRGCQPLTRNTILPNPATPQPDSLFFVKLQQGSENITELPSPLNTSRCPSVSLKEKMSAFLCSSKRSNTNPPSRVLNINHIKSNNLNGSSHIRASKDIQIAKSLSIIVCLFSVCWTPYSVLMVIRSACHGACIEPYWYEIAFWLLWFNSFINPFLYPLCHSSFKNAFSRLLLKQ
ncbi:histamine H4 receptor [Pleurodeles waltl]|uniref:histamine H4 receptor n=1 Tax=Pleurodeles waltl TaxID=8319 RepID=UPI00370960EE